MPAEDADFLTRAYQARDKLIKQFFDRPEVSLIDIGDDPENPGQPQRLVLRVHVRQAAAQQGLGLPEEVDGIPVRVVKKGDYRLQ
jgi:hypothetical protein